MKLRENYYALDILFLQRNRGFLSLGFELLGISEKLLVRQKYTRCSRRDTSSRVNLVWHLLQKKIKKKERGTWTNPFHADRPYDRHSLRETRDPVTVLYPYRMDRCVESMYIDHAAALLGIYAI